MTEIYTDGSATTHDQPGGWSFIVVVNGVKVHSASGGIQNATNNIAELTAAVEGLKYAAANNLTTPLILVADSQLVLHFADGTWNCKKLHLALLANTLNKLFKQLNASTRWVKGHNGDKFNEECDVLAKAEREKLMEDK